MKSPIKVTVYWGDILYDTALFHAGDRVTVGRGPENTFLLDLDPASRFQSIELITVNSNNSVDLKFDDKIDGIVRFKDEVVSLKSIELGRRSQRGNDGLSLIRLSEEETAELVIGHVSFSLKWVRAKNTLPKGTILDWTTPILVALVIAATALLPQLLQFIPTVEPEPKPQERVVTLLPKEALIPRRTVTLPAPTPVAVKTPPVVKPSAKAKPEKLKTAQEEVVAKAAMGKKKTADGGAQKGKIGKATLEARKKNDAVAGIYGSGLGNIVKNLNEIGTEAATAPKRDNTNRVGDPNAGGPINQVGTGGFSTEGMGKGGGGKSLGIGRTVGQGEGGFAGTGRLGLSGNSPIEGGAGHARAPATVTGGGLDGEVIDSIVRRRQDRIRLCYERQLNFYPKLSGKVSVQFVIGAKGNVVANSISEDTMQNENVRSCILNEVKAWTFPAPVGGTLVTVDYPFVFESSARKK